MNQRFFADVLGQPEPPEQPPRVRKRVRKSAPVRPEAAERITLDVTGSWDSHTDQVRPAIVTLDHRIAESAARAIDIAVTNT